MIINNIRKILTREHKIKVLMVGGRRCGKSTLLAAMYNNISNTFMGTSLLLDANENIKIKLNNIVSNLTVDYFTNKDPNSIFTADTSPSKAETPYKFSLQMGSAPTNIAVEFIDIPGEFLDDKYENAQNRDRVKQLIKESHVIMIAIDTPCLMEKYNSNLGYGKYHEQMNKTSVVDLVTREITTDGKIQDRMVLFVPIKCEKYYYRGRMSKDDGYLPYPGTTTVEECVMNGYKGLITSLTSSESYKKHCTTAITPILSLGGIELFSFEEENQESPGMMERFNYTNAHNNYPQKIKEEIKNNYGEYSPRFCDQPLIYVIAFILKVSAKGGWNSGLFSNILSALKFAPDGVSLEYELSKVMSKIKTSGDGYKILNDPLKIGGLRNGN